MMSVVLSHLKLRGERPMTPMSTSKNNPYNQYSAKYVRAVGSCAQDKPSTDQAPSTTGIPSHHQSFLLTMARQDLNFNKNQMSKIAIPRINKVRGAKIDAETFVVVR